MPVLGILLLGFFLVSLPVCFVRPFYGVLMWMVVSFLNPQSTVIYWGPAAAFPWAASVGVATIAGMLVFEQNWIGRLACRETWCIVALGLWFTITTVISVNTPLLMHHASDTWEKWEVVSKILLFTLVTMAIVNSFQRLRTLLLVIGGCFGFFVLKSLPFVLLTGGGDRIYGPEGSMIADNNDFGLALNMTIPIFFLLAQTASKTWLKRVFGSLFVIGIPAVLFTYSRGALLGLIVALFLMVWRMKQRILLVSVVLVGIVLATAFAPESWRQRMNPSGNVVDASARSRLNAWTFCWGLASEFPISGGGFATFTGWLFQRYAPHAQDVHNSHSIYFGVLAEHGFVGLFLYGVLIVSCFATSGKVIRRARLYDDTEAIQYATLLRISIMGFLVSGAFLSRAYFDYYFTIVACIAILKRVSFEEWAKVDGSSMELEEGDSVQLPETSGPANFVVRSWNQRSAW